MARHNGPVCRRVGVEGAEVRANETKTSGLDGVLVRNDNHVPMGVFEVEPLGNGGDSVG